MPVIKTLSFILSYSLSPLFHLSLLLLLLLLHCSRKRCLLNPTQLRWGNVGEVGNTELSPLLETFPLAVQAFEQRFKIKTANPWSDRESFVPKSFHFQLGQAGHVQAESRTVTSSSSSKPKIPGSSQATQKSTPAAAAAASASSTTKKAPSSAASSSSDKSVVRVVFLECREGRSYCV